jgi:hypothetical protein
MLLTRFASRARQNCQRTLPPCSPSLFSSLTRSLSVGHYKESTKKKDTTTTTTTTTQATTEETTDDTAKKPSRIEQMKTLFYEYRYPFLAYYGVTYVTPVIPIYISLQYCGVDGVELLQWVGLGQEKIDMLNPTYVNMAIAGECNELLEFVRLPLVLTTTPQVAKWWRSRGQEEKNE